jgi:ATP-dependent exoDNAse (exonuclease V) alpha subunit
MDRAIHGFINRNLIYTAASRGKGSVTIMIKELGIMRLWKDIPAKPVTNLEAQILSKVCVTDC